ncbi:ATP-binding protein [Streptosporangium sp. NPDC087985]|uniref:sensor histidine kinase n=1 Tax=Streptosporangium sp. NPDC087985 TaxID=3366196 RepID=UPI0037F796B9
MGSIVLVLGMLLARSIAEGQQQAMYVDRLGDTTRFAAIAQQGMTATDLRTLGDELARYDQVYGIAGAVLDRGGEVRVASRALMPAFDGSGRSAVRAALSGRRSENPHLRWPWDRRPIVVAEPVLQGGDVVGVVMTVSPTDALAGRVLRWWALLAIGELVVLAVCVLLALRFTRWVLKPVHTLGRVAHVIATGGLGARVSGASGPPELRSLVTTFNEMADHVETLLDEQRAFVADASHELRNPLSALLLRFEYLGAGLGEEWSHDLDLARAEGRRLTHILDQLLVLARAEHCAHAPDRLDFAALVGERLAVWRVVADRRGIDLEVDASEPVCAIADRAAVSGALDTVLDNALKFSPPGSRVRVEVAQAEDGVEVRVRDEGTGLSPEEIARVGDRFWRSPRHQNIEGTGLGLSIAKTLLTPSGGRLEVRPGAERGLVVAVLVPAVTA